MASRKLLKKLADADAVAAVLVRHGKVVSDVVAVVYEAVKASPAEWSLEKKSKSFLTGRAQRGLKEVETGQESNKREKKASE